MCDFKQQVPVQKRPGRRGFTLVEIVAALAILVGIVASVLVVMEHAVQATIEMRSRQHAFEVARENLESLLTVSTLSDEMDYGASEKYPEIQWELRVEPFYEPISNKMWIRAVSSAGFLGEDNEEQTVELQQWLTGLNAQQIKQILRQQKTEKDILKALYNEEETLQEQMTKYYLEQNGYDVTAYEALLARQRKAKVNYLLEHGSDDGYQDLLDSLEEEFEKFLEDQGVDFDKMDAFFSTVNVNDLIKSGVIQPDAVPDLDTPDTELTPSSSQESQKQKTPDDVLNPDTPKTLDPEKPAAEQPDCPISDCTKIDPSLKPIICQLAGCCCD